MKDFYITICPNCERQVFSIYQYITGEIVYCCNYCQKIHKIREEEE